MKKLIPILLCAALLALFGTGCASTPDPLTTVIEIQSPSGAKAFVSSPKDTGLKSLMFSPDTGELLVEEFSTSASDPTAAYMGVIAEQGKVQAAQSRQMTELLGLLSRQATAYLPAPAPAPAPPTGQ